MNVGFLQVDGKITNTIKKPTMSDKITKDYYINVRYEGDPVPDKAGRVEQNIAEGIFKAFSDWPNCKIEVEATSTINIPKPNNAK